MAKRYKTSEPLLSSNFAKVRPQMLSDLFDATNSKTGTIVSYLLSEINYSNNTVITTNEEIAKGILKKTGNTISPKTVVKTMQILEDKNFIKRRRGAVMFNPVLIAKGKDEKEHILLEAYNTFNNQKLEENKIISTERHPIAFDDSLTLILGDCITMEDFNTGQYYSDPNDFFWEFISQKSVNLKNNYENQKVFLKNSRYALWYMAYQKIDVRGNRVKVLNEYYNDLEKFLEEHPSIQLIMCNGSKAFQKLSDYLKKKNLNLSCEIMTLSNSNGVRGVGKDNFEKYEEEWIQAYMNVHYPIISFEEIIKNPEAHYNPIYDADGNIINNATGRFDHLLNEY